jgi:hypothetical protein
MTNRINYTTTFIEPKTKSDEVILIAFNLTEKGKPLTLANAMDALKRGLANAPEMWMLTEDDLPTLWAALVKEAI